MERNIFHQLVLSPKGHKGHSSVARQQEIDPAAKKLKKLAKTTATTNESKKLNVLEKQEIQGAANGHKL